MTAALVPEFYVSDLARSLDFYCGMLGFRIVYQRSEERFAYIERNGAELMLEEPVGRIWLAGPLEPPYGRGVNFQIEVENATALRDAALAAGARDAREDLPRQPAQAVRLQGVREVQGGCGALSEELPSSQGAIE